MTATGICLHNYLLADENTYIDARVNVQKLSSTRNAYSIGTAFVQLSSFFPTKDYKLQAQT